LQLTFALNDEAVDLSAYNAIRFHARGEGWYKIYFLQPSIDDWDNYGSRVLEATPEWRQVTIAFKELKQAGWGVQKPFTPQALRSVVIEPVTGKKNPPRPPSGLYNGMIAPLVPFAMRGAIWYQGESNAWAAYQYRKLLPALIRGWREVWDQGQFPFLIVQLANWLERKDEPGENEWAELREAQLMALELPATGLAVTIDIGDTWDIHPKNKQDVGHRLALWALGTTYGKDLVYSGPLYESMAKDGTRVRVKFKHTGSGLVAKGKEELKGFAVAGVDKKFYWAEAKIEDDTVLVWSDKVPEPVAVRYAWASNPGCNLYNKEGLPASPFRTDDWPGITANKK
jgi:sialate O-acetylesterase